MISHVTVYRKSRRATYTHTKEVIFYCQIHTHAFTDMREIERDGGYIKTDRQRGVLIKHVIVV